ncbi:MAG: hypothetical protein ACPGFA_10130 [Pikeienuella sp.]
MHGLILYGRIFLSLAVFGGAVLADTAEAEDRIFERDLSSPFLRGPTDNPLQERDLPGPLRKSWPYASAPAAPFLAVEARRGCHARAMHEMRRMGAREMQALDRLQSESKGDLLFDVIGHYEVLTDAGKIKLTARCTVSSRQVMSFELSE